MGINNFHRIPVDFSLCEEVFENFGERRLIDRGEYFMRSGEVMEYAGWIVSRGFKYSGRIVRVNSFFLGAVRGICI